MIAYGSVYLPDSVTAAHAEQDIGGIYSVNGSGQAESAGAPAAGGAAYNSEIKALKIFPIKKITVDNAKRKYVAIGGEVFGIKLYTKGAIVVNVDAVTSKSGNSSPGTRVSGRGMS